MSSAALKTAICKSLDEGTTFDPSENLARDEYLLKGSKVLPAYRLWVNADCVVLGRHLVPEEEVHLGYAHEAGIPVLRRISGGGAVFHDLGVLNYSVACGAGTAGWNFAESLRFLSSPLLRTLEALGLDWNWEGANNVYLCGRKISGSAQARRGGLVLHHGSILIAADIDKMKRILRPGGRSNHAAVGNLRDFMPGITVGDVTELLRAQVATFVDGL